MANPFYANSPLDFNKLEGVIISESNPPVAPQRASANSVILVGDFERGPANDPERVASIEEVAKKYGNPQENGLSLYGGNKALRLKAWPDSLYVVRAVASDAQAATVTQTVATKDLVTLTALSKGAWGNGIEVVIADGSNANTKKITIVEGDSQEVYDNLEIAGKSDAELEAIFKDSKLVKVTGAHANDEPENATLNLAAGDDGTLDATDYKSAIEASNINVRGKIYFTDDQSAAVKTALANFVKSERDGIAVVGTDDASVSVDDAITQADLLQDQEGRVIYVYNHIKFPVLGTIQLETPVFLTASLLGLTPPNLSLAAAANRVLTQTAVGVNTRLSRADFIKLRDGGICGYEDDQDLGVRMRSAVTGNTQWSINRRRMSDFLISSLARYLKNFQNEPNSLPNRASIRAAIRGFDDGLVRDGILPSDADAGTTVLKIETEGTSTPEEQAQGIQKIIYQRRIFAEMKFIVLQAQIGESVTIEEV